jgi:hypothetical protein
VKEHELINSPWCLSVAADTIAVLDFGENVFVYNFEGHLRFVIQETSLNSICMYGGHLYAHSNNGYVICYRKSEKKYDQHSFEVVGKTQIEALKAYSAFVIYHNDKLIVSFGEKKFLALINPNNYTK